MDLPNRPPANQPSRASLILGLYGALGVAAFAIGFLRGHANVYQFDGSAGWKLALSPVIGITIGLAVVFVTRLCVHRFEWARRLHRSFRGLLGALSARDILILALASSIGEELFFRGALLPWLGIWGSTLIFALLHVGPGLRYLPWTLSAFLIGLLFGGLFLTLRDLGAPIVAHFTINYLNLGYIVRVDLPGD